MSVEYAIGALLALFLVALVAGNNISSCTGSIISSRIVKKRTGIAIAALGYVLGLVIQGSNLHLGVLALAPGIGEGALLATILASLIIFVAAHIKKALMPLSIVFAGAIVGAAIGSNIRPDTGFLTLLALFWVVAPVVTLLVALAIGKDRPKASKHIWKSLDTMRILLVIVSFITAFTLGANTFGFVYSAIGGHSIYLLSLFIIAIAVGSFLFSSGQLRTIGDKIMTLRYRNALNTQLVSSIAVEIATLFGVPLSNTQTFAAGVFGSGLSYKEHLIGIRTMRNIVASWIISLAGSFVLGYGLTILITHLAL